MLQLEELRSKDWLNLLPWLHTSGLALYLLARLEDLGFTHLLPAAMLAQLQQSLKENAIRTSGMMAELSSIHNGFEAHGLSYAALKGCSLTPHSVPRLELRHQFDLDFLLAGESLDEARQVLERQGYHLHAVSRRSWEFKKDERVGISLRDFYKDNSGRTVELHLRNPVPGNISDLDRAERRRFKETELAVLSPVDLFLGQGMHVYKHMRGEFTRTSHLLEFARHISVRFHDDAFWSALRARAQRTPESAIGLGAVTLLIMRVMGEPAPQALKEWTVDILPPTVRLWLSLYGDRVAFGDVPGTKLYLVLERALKPSGSPRSRSVLSILLPHRPPPSVIRAARVENVSTRVRRYRMQLRYMLLRLRFHLVEGLRYGWETYRWTARLDEFTR